MGYRIEPVSNSCGTKFYQLLAPGVQTCTCSYISFRDRNKIYEKENCFAWKCYQENTQEKFRKNSLTKFTSIAYFGAFFKLASSVSSFSKLLRNIFQDISPD